MARRFRLKSTLAVALLAGSTLGGFAFAQPSFADTGQSGQSASGDVSQLPSGVFGPGPARFHRTRGPGEAGGRDDPLRSRPRRQSR